MTVGNAERVKIQMTKLPSGHRTISLIGRDPRDFKLDPELAKRFPSFTVDKPEGDYWQDLGDK
eukprot:4268102-Pyramimonas_sp.AAC.1